MAHPSLTETDLRFLRAAIELGREGMNQGAGGPFGALLVTDGTVVGEGFNRVLADGDPTSHAEMVAIRAACQPGNGPWLPSSTIYSSCEPCPMCLAAIYWARIPRVVYAAQREDAASVGFDDAEFYDELAKGQHERRVVHEQSLREEARTMMEAWRKQGPDSAY
jgi:tRNA(Arg) A34 adenosine deaminase TadA